MGCLLFVLGGGAIMGVAIGLALMVLNKEAKAKVRAREILKQRRIEDAEEVDKLIRILGRSGIDKESQHLCKQLLDLRDKAG